MEEYSMTNNEEKLLDLYDIEFHIAKNSYDFMGKLLDKKFVKNFLERMNIRQVYIYGAGYLGIQMYNVINDLLDECVLIDKSKKSIISDYDDLVMGINEAKEKYDNQFVIITPFRYYNEIFDELSEWVPSEKIVLISELLDYPNMI